MTTTIINIIVALSKHNRAIGKNNELLWRISDDLKRFKILTNGHPVIMGRKTYESIGRALPNRTNIIITRNTSYLVPNCLICTSIDKAIKTASEIDQQVFIIGGAEIYRETINLATRLYLTIIDERKEGDTFFPTYNNFQKIISQENKTTDTGLKYQWLVLEK